MRQLFIRRVYTRTVCPALLLLVVVTACTPLQTVTPPAWDQRRARLLELNGWELRGRLAVRGEEDGGQARLHWQQSGDVSQLRLSGPFGAGAVAVLWAPDLVSVTDAAGERFLEYRGVNAAEDFMHDQLGWSFPAGSVRYWVMGLLDPTMPGQEQFDAAGALIGLSQHGWDVSYEGFSDFAGDLAGIALPTRMNIENGSTRLRIVISKWSVPAVDG